MARPYRLSAENVREVRRLLAEGASAVDLAAAFDVSESTVRLIALRRKWASLPEEPGVDRAATVAAYREAAARRRAAARGNAKLDDAAVREVRALLRAGVPGVEVARRFAVSKATVSKVRNGRAWANVDERERLT